jgi:hypothetical protein
MEDKEGRKIVEKKKGKNSRGKNNRGKKVSQNNRTKTH